MSAEKCPVCGERLIYRMDDGVGSYACGKARFEDCGNAERLAIERAAEVERLRGLLRGLLDCIQETRGPDATRAVHDAQDALKET